MAPGVELVRIAADRYTLRSEFDAFELAGEAASDFAQNVLVELHNTLALDEIHARLPGYAPDSVTGHVELLVSRGLVVEIATRDAPPLLPFGAFLDVMGRDTDDVARRLAQLKVAVFGLEAHGAHLARMLAQIGVGAVRLVDPHPLEAGHLALASLTKPESAGLSLQVAVAHALAPFDVRVECEGDAVELDAARVRSIVDGCDIAFGCWDQTFLAASHWLNQAAIETGVPVLFGELRASSTITGPLLLPGRSACWMCYRMRSIACAPDFEQAMSFEEHLDRTRRPRLASRASLPALPELLASSMALETLRVLLGLHPPIHVDSVSEYDAMSGAVQNHPVLAVPNCPVCSKKVLAIQPPLDELIEGAPEPANLLELVPRLVDAKTGIVSHFSAVPRDVSESPVPLVWRAKVANHRFLSEHDEERATCSGKGMIKEQAWVSCLGEAVERYSASSWNADELVIASRASLDGRSLDPRELVLYADEQYDALPYTRYRDSAELAWVRSRSLVHGDEVWAPAMAVLMDYPIQTAGEFLFPITSSGLAAGPTLHHAVLGAVTEVLERDAALISWYNELPGNPHDPHQHPDADVRRLASLYRSRGIELALIGLVTDHPVSVFMGIALQGQSAGGPSAVVGLGADIDPIAAARKAALEVGQVRPAIRRRARREGAARVHELVADPTLVESMEDHALLYTDPQMADQFRFLFGERRPWCPRIVVDPAAGLRRIVEHFAGIGQEVLYANLTPPDMAAVGIFTARAIVPDFQPISFGKGERRLGGRRLYEFATQQGLRSAEATPAELNPMPHPIA
jgi:ribosomal protein S12 methylthiotransferase accessory factor